MEFVVDEQLHAVAFGEAVDQPVRVLRHAVGGCTGDADIQHAVALAREDVDAGVHGLCPKREEIVLQRRTFGQLEMCLATRVPLHYPFWY